MPQKRKDPAPRSARKSPKEKADIVFSRLSAIDPNPKTELQSTNPFTLLVAIVLSAQATDAGVNKATPALFKAADTPQEMLALGEAKVREYIKTINFNNGKARNVIGLSKALVEQYGGEVPVDFDALITLPGVGAKTAKVWLNCVHGRPLIAVDTHVFRVANRLGLCKTKTPEQTAEVLERVVPEKWKVHAHHWLILHGRYTCKARRPECERCVLTDVCNYYAKMVKAAA